MGPPRETPAIHSDAKDDGRIVPALPWPYRRTTPLSRPDRHGSADGWAARRTDRAVVAIPLPSLRQVLHAAFGGSGRRIARPREVVGKTGGVGQPQRCHDGQPIFRDTAKDGPG